MPVKYFSIKLTLFPFRASPLRLKLELQYNLSFEIAPTVKSPAEGLTKLEKNEKKDKKTENNENH